MKVDGPDLDALPARASSTRAQLQARKLGKIAAAIPNLRPNARLLLGRLDNWATSMLQKNSNAAHHLMSSGSWKIHRIDFSIGFFKGCFDGWHIDESYAAEVLAVGEQEYLPVVPVPVQP